jgi:DNA-binding transcriptional regulator YiaG
MRSRLAVSGRHKPTGTRRVQKGSRHGRFTDTFTDSWPFFAPFLPKILRFPYEIEWRKGWFLNPFCHLVIKAVRVDSHPCQNSPQSLAELLINYRLKLNFSRTALASKLGVSLGTLKNWECGRTQPNRRFWRAIRLLNQTRTSSTF